MLVFILVAATLAFVVSWTVNTLISMMSGEHPGDTGRQFGDIFLRILGITRLGFVGVILDRINGPRWYRWLIYAAGALFIVSTLLRALR